MLIFLVNCFTNDYLIIVCKFENVIGKILINSCFSIACISHLSSHFNAYNDILELHPYIGQESDMRSLNKEHLARETTYDHVDNGQKSLICF